MSFISFFSAPDRNIVIFLPKDGVVEIGVLFIFPKAATYISGLFGTNFEDVCSSMKIWGPDMI